MCGIAGLANCGDREVQEHCGPDDSGLWERRVPGGSYIGLGRRLAILGPFGRWPHTDVQPDFLVPPLSLFRRDKGQYECSGRPELFLAVTILE
jgi:hypothetical protein